MFRPISGHPHVHNWCIKYIDEEMYFQLLVSDMKYTDRAKDRWTQSVYYGFTLRNKQTVKFDAQQNKTEDELLKPSNPPLV
jgi:hypothetical protein